MNGNNAIRLCHLYGQAFYHAPAYIVGNREGLIALRNAIDRALVNGRGQEGLFVQDGKGFAVHAIMDDSDWQSETWRLRAVPYTDECAKESRPDAIGPWQEVRGVCAK